MSWSTLRRLARKPILIKTFLVFLIILVVIHGYFMYSLFKSLFDVRYVASSSMAPYVPKGSIVVIYKDPVSYGIGDIVEYHYPQAEKYKLLHRVNDIRPEYVIVKGDNVKNTEKIGKEHIEGKLVGGIPYIGIIREILVADPLFTYLLILVLLAITLFSVKE